VKHAVSTTAQLVSANDFTQLRGLLSRAELRRLKKEVPLYLFAMLRILVIGIHTWTFLAAFLKFN
jgi:hypothetical protein